MKHFHYESNLRDVATRFQLLACLILIWLSGVIIYQVIERDFSILFAALILVPASFICVKLFLHGVYIRKSDRDWEISISEDIIYWKAPTNLMSGLTEASFEYKPSEIEKIVCKFEKWNESSEQYSLVLKNRKVIDLNFQSGVPVNKFLEAMARVGIFKENVYEEN